MNKSSLDRGFGRCIVLRKYGATMKKYMNRTKDQVLAPELKPGEVRLPCSRGVVPKGGHLPPLLEADALDSTTTRKDAATPAQADKGGLKLSCRSIPCAAESVPPVRLQLTAQFELDPSSSVHACQITLSLAAMPVRTPTRPKHMHIFTLAAEPVPALLLQLTPQMS